jgi:cellobiose transport system substrate-binding protein
MSIKKLSVKTLTLLVGASLAFGSLGGLSPAQALTINCKDAKDDGNGCTVVTFAYFGDIVNHNLIADYRKIHPEIKIEEQKATALDALKTRLDTECSSGGTGNADVAAIEVQYTGYWKTKSQCFVDLRTLKTTVGKKSATDIKKDYLDWRWAQGVAHDNKVIGIPTDVGGLEVAYRWDMFKIVGMPYKRDEVSKSWNTWDKFISVGKEYAKRVAMPKYKSAFTKAKTKPKGFMDNVGSIYAAYLNQGTAKYYKKDGVKGVTIYKTNTAIRKAFDLALKADSNGIGTRIGQFSSDWRKGMLDGTFAVILSPAWMLEYIRVQAPDTSGKWDIATIPGGGGNMGGSQLTIPAGAKHKQEAWDFITWYLAPEQQLKMFTDETFGGIFPSTKALYTNKKLIGKADDFFNGAYVGKIYAEGIKDLKPIYEGINDRCIDQEFGNALSLVINKKEKDAGKAFTGAISAIDRKCRTR